MSTSGPSEEIYADTLSVFDHTSHPEEPFTTTEVADALDVPRRTAYKRLDTLAERGDVYTKKVGASARVWWRPDSSPPDGRTGHTANQAAESITGMLDGADVGVFILDENLDVAWINDATERCFGLDRDRVVGQDKRTLVEETIADRIEEPDTFADTVLATYNDNTYTERFECRVTPGENRDERWLEHRSKPLDTGHYAGGRVELYYDITEQKRSDRARRDTEHRFRSLVDAVEEYAIFMLDPDGHVQNWNSGAERLKGYEEDEIVGKHFSTFYTDDQAADVPAENLAAAREHGSVEDEGWRVRADGTRFWANVTITAIRDTDGDLKGYAKITRDMTGRRERERQLRRERNLTDRLLETAPVRLAIFRPDGSVERMNSKARQQLGLDDTDLAEFSFGHFELSDTDGEPISRKNHPVMTVIETGDPVHEQVVQHVTPDGEHRWASLNVSPLFNDGELERIVVAGKDITNLKETEQALARQRDQLQTELNDVFTRITDGMLAVDTDWTVTYVNDHAQRLLDNLDVDLHGKHLWDEFPERIDSDVWEKYHEAMETQCPVTFETYSDVVGGWVEARAYPSESGLSVYFRDITERKERETALEEARNRYQTLIEHFPNGAVTLVDHDLRYVTAGGTPIEEADVTLEDLTGQPLRECLPPDFADELVPRYEAALDGEQSAFQLEFGDRVHQFRIVPVRNDSGEVFAAMGTSQDITELKARERELEQYERLVETMDDGIYAVNEDAEFVLVNDAFCELTGYDREELLESHAITIHDDHITPTAEELAGEVVAGGRDIARIELDIYQKNGERLPAESRLGPFPMADGTGRCGVVRDISERKARERELERYETIVETVKDGIYALNDDMEFTMVNDALADMTGVSNAEMLGQSAWDFVANDDDIRGEVTDRIEEMVAGDREAAAVEIEVATAECTTFPAEIVFTVRDTADGLEHVGVVRDITDQKHREQELARFKRAVEASGHAIYMTDTDGRITYVNPAFTEIAGYTAEEAVGETPHLLNSGEHDDAYYQRLWNTVRAGDVWDEEIIDQRKSGDHYYADQTIAPVTDEVGELDRFVAVQTDITERKHREKQLQQQNDRLDSFASMLAHELRNPVTVGQIYSQQLPANTDSVAVEYVTEAFDRIEDMIDVMLVLTRGRQAVGESTTISLAEVAREAWDEAETLEATIDIESDGEIDGDEMYLRHLFRNLFENAAEHGGREVAVTVGDLPTGFYVADDGAGIPADERDAVFEAGYTTASENGGTGLGLAFVHELADVYNWQCTLTENAGGGTRFEFRDTV